MASGSAELWAAVEPVLERHRKLREIGSIAFEHDLLHRRLVARDLHDVLRRVEAMHDFLEQFALGHAERHQLGMLADDDVAAGDGLAGDVLAAAACGHCGQREIAAALKIIGSDPKVQAVLVMSSPVIGTVPRLVADSERARRELGWSPRYGDLDSIIGTALEATKAEYAQKLSSSREVNKGAYKANSAAVASAAAAAAGAHGRDPGRDPE